MLDNSLNGYPYFPLAVSFFSWIFPLHITNEKIYRQGGKMCLFGDFSFWTFPKVSCYSVSVVKNFPKSNQYSTGMAPSILKCL